MENKEKLPPLLINIQSISREDDLEVERNTQSLRDELYELDVIEKVELVTEGEPPEGSKPGGEVVVWGSLVATLAASAGSALIPSLANTLQSWLTRHGKRKIYLEIGEDKLEVTGISDQDQQKLINAWLSRHV